MAEYIEKGALMNHIESEARIWGDDYDAHQILGDIEDCPPADVRPVRRGSWIISCDGWYPYCSCCKQEPPGREVSYFCPNCGADMRGDDAQ